MSYELETDIEGFVARWLRYTGSYDDFTPAFQIWDAMLHSAGRDPARKRVWGMTRQEAFEELRELLDLKRQQNRYYRPPGAPRGYSTGCYERVLFTPYAVDALKAPIRVRRRQLASAIR